jgi:hypothetical protein
MAGIAGKVKSLIFSKLKIGDTTESLFKKTISSGQNPKVSFEL